MPQTDLQTLSAIRTEIDGVTVLKKRFEEKLEQVLARYFSTGTFETVLSAPDEMSTFQFACYLKESVAVGCSCAETAAQNIGEPFYFWANALEDGRRYRLHIEARVPPAEPQAQKQFLRNMSYVLGRLLVHMDLSLQDRPEERFFAELYQSSPSENTEANRERVIDQFKTLVAHEREDLPCLPAGLVSLAGWLSGEERLTIA